VRNLRFNSLWPVGAVAILLIGSLFASSGLTQNAPAWLRLLVIEAKAVCEDASIQWLVVVCLVQHIAFCSFLEFRLVRASLCAIKNPNDLSVRKTVGGNGLDVALRIRRFGKTVMALPDFWLLTFVFFTVLRYFLDYETSSKSLQLTGLLSGVAAGKTSVCLLTRGYRGKRTQVALKLRVLLLLVFVLSATAMWQSGGKSGAFYRGINRWEGIWNSPNHYGVLMGTGLVVAVGLMTVSCKVQGSRFARSWAFVTRPIARLILIAAGITCAVGLLKSFSRGAWLGTAGALALLLFQTLRHIGTAGAEGRSVAALRRHWFALSTMCFSLMIVGFWQFRHTEQPLLRRMFSVANVNDFSWRNRVTAWGCGIAALAEKPITGYGWSSWGTSFQKNYKAERLENLQAIWTNDFLIIGISCGLPALACLMIHVCRVFWRTLFRGQLRSDGTLSPTNKVGMICAAGALVMAVGFFFTSGLMNLKMCVLFWTLLELARVGSANDVHRMKAHQGAERLVEVGSSPATKAIQQKQTAVNTGSLLRFAAIIVMTIAIGLTGFHLGAPHLGVTKRSISIARKYLVPPNCATDFDLLASKPLWSEKKLKTLLTHVELANYTRQLVNWKLDDEIYREFVLSPGIEPRVDSDLDWRRELWEYFYPRIRKMTDVSFASEAIGSQLKGRFKLDGTMENTPARSIHDTWQSRNQPVSQFEFEALTVAALRSSGIPARLNSNSCAEFWDGKEWRFVFQKRKQ